MEEPDHTTTKGHLAGIASSVVIFAAGRLWRIRPILSSGETPILFLLMGPIENGMTVFTNPTICTGSGVTILDLGRSR